MVSERNLGIMNSSNVAEMLEPQDSNCDEERKRENEKERIKCQVCPISFYIIIRYDIFNVFEQK